MKRTHKTVYMVIEMCIFFLFFCITVQAQDIQSIIEDLNNTSDYSALSEFAQKSENAVEALLPANIFEFFLSCVKDSLSGVTRPMLTLMSIILVANVVSIYKDNLSVSSATLDYATLLAVMLVSFSLVTPLIVTVSDYLSDYTLFINSMSGTLSLVLTSSGNVSAAAASSASSAFTMGITQIISVNIILPCARAVIALSTISTLSQSIDLSGITGFIRSFCTWGMGVLFAVFGGVHSAAVKIAAGADSLAVRGIRFSAARLIPVAGNMISESMKTVLTGMSIIKSTAGGLGIAYILYSLLPAVCSVLCVKIVILTASFFSKLMGMSKHTSFFEGINASLNILLAVCVFASVSGIIIFAVFMSTTVNV